MTRGREDKDGTLDRAVRERTYLSRASRCNFWHSALVRRSVVTGMVVVACLGVAVVVAAVGPQDESAVAQPRALGGGAEQLRGAAPAQPPPSPVASGSRSVSSGPSVVDGSTAGGSSETDESETDEPETDESASSQGASEIPGPCDRRLPDYELVLACEGELATIHAAPVSLQDHRAVTKRLSALYERFERAAAASQRETKVAAIALMGECLWEMRERGEALAADLCREKGVASPDCFELMAMADQLSDGDQTGDKLREIYETAIKIADRDGLDTRFSRLARERQHALKIPKTQRP